MTRLAEILSTALLGAVATAALSACGDTINPVRFQPVPVVVVKPCFSGRTPPTEATLLTDPACTGSDADCVRAAKADILELQREARQYRVLYRECSK